MLKTPVVTTEEDIKNKFWTPEPYDRFLPSPGFITDFVYATRGIMTPTKFCVWSAIFAVSGVLKRHAWLKWHPGKFFANMFIFLIAPPRICAKTTAYVNWIDSGIYDGYEYYITDPKLKIQKKLRTLRSKATEASIFKLLKPRKAARDPDTGVYAPIGSDAVFITGELATFLGKHQYNIGLVQRLISLYDCNEKDEYLTIRGGKELLRDIYVSMIAASTRSGLAESVPESALCDGFLSRVIILNQEFPVRKRYFPLEVIGAKSIETMKKDLAWIAENATGEYIFTPEAESAYKEWFDKHFDDLVKSPSTIKYRLDIHLLKLALIIRVQRYQKGNKIELKDFMEAWKLLEPIVGDIDLAIADVGGGFISKQARKLSEWIKARKEVTRLEAMRTFSGKGITSQLMSTLINELAEREEIEIHLNGNKCHFATRNGKERYKWIKRK